jgi:hypothetical protein
MMSGNCDLRSTLSGCNAAIMSIQFDTEVSRISLLRNNLIIVVWGIRIVVECMLLFSALVHLVACTLLGCVCVRSECVVCGRRTLQLVLT